MSDERDQEAAVDTTGAVPGSIDDLSRGQCQAAANLQGEHIPCDYAADHTGWAHGNKEWEILWTDGPNLTVPQERSALTPEQDARSSALYAARGVLERRGGLGNAVTPPARMDLLSVAQWILTGSYRVED